MFVLKPNMENKISNIIDDLIESEAKRERIISDTKYLEWLEKFTTEKEYFTDNDWLYCPEKLSKKDSENVANLEFLYDVIDLYAKNNYIYSNKCHSGNYYNIKFNDNGYEIGMVVGQGTMVFCNRTQIKESVEYIDFYDVMNNKKRENVEVISAELEDLSLRVLELYKKGIPLDYIKETLDNTLLEIHKEENQTVKTLKRV